MQMINMICLPKVFQNIKMLLQEIFIKQNKKLAQENIFFQG
jgi:hypothetical protein